MSWYVLRQQWFACVAFVFSSLLRWCDQFGWDASLFPTIEDDIDFTKKLLAEECVFVLPGQVCGASFTV
jgi:aspartate/methionine/tyrosine aminotransferase